MKNYLCAHDFVRVDPGKQKSSRNKKVKVSIQKKKHVSTVLNYTIIYCATFSSASVKDLLEDRTWIHKPISISIHSYLSGQNSRGRALKSYLIYAPPPCRLWKGCLKDYIILVLINSWRRWLRADFEMVMSMRIGILLHIASWERGSVFTLPLSIIMSDNAATFSCIIALSLSLPLALETV